MNRIKIYLTLLVMCLGLSVGQCDIIINDGVTLIIDRDTRSSQDMVLNGGTLLIQGVNARFDNLTLTDNSYIDFSGTEDNKLRFKSITLNTNTLYVLNYTIGSDTFKVDNWSGGGSIPQIIFISPQGSRYEAEIYEHYIVPGRIIPIPEPNTLFCSGILLIFTFLKHRYDIKTR